MKHGRKASLFLLTLFLSCLFVASAIPQVESLPQTDVTFYSEAALDGIIWKSDTSYPPTTLGFDSSSSYIVIGQLKTTDVPVVYYMERAYFSFDTSSIPDDTTVVSSKLRIRLSGDDSVIDFDINLFSGSYGNSLGTDDWSAVTTSEGIYRNTEGMSVGTWYEKTVSTNSIIKTGRSQYKMVSSREGTQPTGKEKVDWYSGDSAYDPELIVTYESEIPFFYGLYNEDSGLLYPKASRAVNVTAYFMGRESETCEVNGTHHYDFPEGFTPLYFEFGTSLRRQYWLSPSEISASIYIFDSASLKSKTISFVDLSGVLKTSPYVEARRLINGTYFTVEKRKVDADRKVVLNLVEGEKYSIVISGETTSYTFGDLLITSSTSIELILKGIEFPKETLIVYKYVRIYGTRQFSSPSGITIIYQDTLAQTNSVVLNFKYKNGTIADSATRYEDFTYVWLDAYNNTDYIVDAVINHGKFGTYTWKQYFTKQGGKAGLSLDVFGSLPIDLSAIIPAFLILLAMGCFSMINAEIGAFAGCVTAAILTYMGFIFIPGGYLISAFLLAFCMAIIYKKRSVQVY